MVENKKTDEKKPSRKKIKASTGAWWKSTVIEEDQEKPVAGSAEKETSSATKKASKRSPRKTAAAAAAAETKKSAPKRGTRKKSEATATAEPQQPVEDVTGEPAAVDTDSPEPVSADSGKKPARAPRKKSPRKKAAAEEATTETVAADTVVEADKASEAEAQKEEAPKRTPAKRSPRKKKTASAPEVEAESAVTAELQPAEAEVQAETAVQAEAEVVEPQAAEAPEETPVRKKRAPRKRSPRKPKEVEAAVEEAVESEAVESEAVSGDVVEPVEQADTLVEQEAATQAPAEAAEKAEQEEEPTAARKKPSSRRNRGRRGGAKKNQELAEPAETEEALEEAVVESAAADQAETAEAEQAETPSVDVSAELPDEEEDKGDIVLKLLINAEEPEECRLALLENGRLESIHVSTINRTLTKNNIYKGRIVAIEPNLQAAFVDYGTEKNGFLPFSEIHPEYYRQDLSEDIQKLVDAHHWKKLSITDVVEKGQDVLVQVVKEEVGKKGANMTTYLSLPGRSVVLMPGSDSSGISRKISGEERRTKLRNAMNSLDIPEGIGWIVRTASIDITKSALGRDVGYLLRLWEEIKKKAQEMDGVGQVYEDHQSVLRFLREHFDPSIEDILVDDSDAMEQVKEFISLLPSKQRDVKVRLHKGSRPIFNQFSVEDQIESIYQPRVNLPSGGSIVIEPTEALVSIDVNSGSTSKGKNFDQSIYQANLEAASELARQLRLRDLGGLIVVDFIDMRNKKHIRDVERQLKQAMKRDKAKVDFSRISKFGLMQISRQKLGSPIEAGNYRVCQHCKGRGTVRSVETLALFYLRRIQTGASRKHVSRVECRFPLDVAQYLLNNKRHEIHEHETRYTTEITIAADPSMSPIEHEITLHKAEKEQNGKKQG